MAEIATQSVAAPRPPWRFIAVAALILSLAVAAAVYVGSRPRLPAPFGPARDGQIVWIARGDIYGVDALTGVPHPIVSSDALESHLSLSRDGTAMAFLRTVTGGSDVYVASIDGTAQRRLNTTPLIGVDRVAWSPDGRTIALDHSVAGRRVISVLAADGRGTTDIDTAGIDAEWPDWRPPDGQELVFRGVQDGKVDLYVIRPDGTGLRPLGVELHPYDRSNVQEILLRPVWSPDGTRVAFHTSDLVDGDQRWQSHVFDVSTGSDTVISSSDLLAQHDTEPMWSPDGTRLVTQRFVYGSADWMAVTTADGRSSIDAEDRSPFSGGGWFAQFSPDGKTVIGYHTDTHQVVTFDALTGRTTNHAWAISEQPAWQRLAPSD